MRKTAGFVFLLCVLSVWMVLFQGDAKGVNAQEEPKPTKEEASQEREPLLLDQVQEDTPEGPVVSYLIEAQLFPKQRKLTAAQTLTWRNTTQHTVDRLRFHLYYNAFRNPDTTFMQEAEFYKKSKFEQKRLKFGAIKIKEIRRIGGVELTENMRFISPDDGNPQDRTVMELKLDRAVQPGREVRLKIEFVLAIPQIFYRTGAVGNYFFMAQWYPKIGVLQNNGQWHCHQYHRDADCFGDFGEFRAILTVPERFKVGAVGNLAKKEKNADKTVTYWYQEKNIHDFAWTAYPRFKKILDNVKLPGNNEDTTVELLLSPGHSGARGRYLTILKYALDFFARHIFPYPYKKLTLVDPPTRGISSGAMAYPTMISGIHINVLPGSLKLLETITVHELALQYWGGMVGTDGAREAWLDKGVATFFQMEIMEQYFQDTASALDSSLLRVKDWELARLMSAFLLPVDAVNQYSWKFLNFFQYSGNVYTKAALLLKSLKNLVGKEQMYNFFKYFAGKYRFKNPTTEDFIHAFNAFMNDDFSWAFEQFIQAEQGLDQAVHSVEAVKLSSKPDKYRNEAIFIRKEGYFPVELLITLENGKEIKSFWKEKEKWKKIVFEDTSPIRAAVLDPLYKVPLDRNFLNNSNVCHPGTSGIKGLALRIGFFFQNILGAVIL
jgi:hypothetical protein